MLCRKYVYCAVRDGPWVAIEVTDSGPISIDLSADTLRTIDEFPYHAALEVAHTEFVMSSNVTYPALDPNRPASLSRPIIQGELRERLRAGVSASERGWP